MTMRRGRLFGLDEGQWRCGGDSLRRKGPAISFLLFSFSCSFIFKATNPVDSRLASPTGTRLSWRRHVFCCSSPGARSRVRLEWL